MEMLYVVCILFFGITSLEAIDKVTLVKGRSGFIPFQVQNLIYPVHIYNPNSVTIITCNKDFCDQDVRGRYVDNASLNDSYVEVGIMNLKLSDSGQWQLKDKHETYTVSLTVEEKEAIDKVTLVKGRSGFIPFQVQNLVYPVHIYNPNGVTIITCNKDFCDQDVRGRYVDNASLNDSYVEVGIMNLKLSDSGQWQLKDKHETYTVSLTVDEKGDYSSSGSKESMCLSFISTLLLLLVVSM